MSNNSKINMDTSHSRPALGDLSNVNRSNSFSQIKSPFNPNTNKTPLFQPKDENEGATGKISRTKSLFENNQGSADKKFGSSIEISDVLMYLFSLIF